MKVVFVDGDLINNGKFTDHGSIYSIVRHWSTNIVKIYSGIQHDGGFT